MGIDGGRLDDLLGLALRKGHSKVASMVQGLGNALCSGSPEEMRRRCCGVSRPPASWLSASTSGTMSLRSPSWRSRYLRPHRPRHSGRRLLRPRANEKDIIIVPSQRLVVARFGPAFTERDDMDVVARLVADVIAAMPPS